MAQAAYDRYNSTARRRAQPRQKPQLQVAQGGKRRLSPLQSLVHNMLPVLALGILVGLAFNLLHSEATITELTGEIQAAQATLTDAQSEYNYYTTALNSKANITEVEQAASRLGLMKMDSSQITYVRLDSASVLTRPESAVAKWGEQLYAAMLALIGLD